MSKPLKLVALDSEDLSVLSAHVQDATVKSGDIKWLPQQRRLAIVMNRFAWESPTSRRRFFPKHERRLAGLHFESVQTVRSKGIDIKDSSTILSLIAVRFTRSGEDGDPSGNLQLVFSGDAFLEAKVECLEAQLSDMGAAWSTRMRPKHSVDATSPWY